MYYEAGIGIRIRKFMVLKISQDLRQTQNLMMTPQLQQAIKLLTVPHLEMTQIITKELMENPVLEESDVEIVDRLPSNEIDYDIERLEMQNREEIPNIHNDNQSSSESTSGNFEGNDNSNSYEENYLEGYTLDQDYASKSKSMISAPDPEEVPNYENIVSKEKTLAEYLEWQLRMENLSEEEWKIAELIIHNLNDDGYLEISLSEIMEKSQSTLPTVNKVLETVQNLDPIGCGSSSLQECLLVQARSLCPRNMIAEVLLDKYFPELEEKNYGVILRKEGIPKEKFDQVLQTIRELNPRPGLCISPSDTHYIIPDIYVHFVGDELVVSMNDEGVPRLRISKYYQSMLDALKGDNGNSGRDQNTKNYVREKLRSAVWLIKSIHNRQKTIHKVAEAIVKLQPDFFRKGPSKLKPMILKDIANEIGMHESTVSRVTINKYMHTPLGTFELKYFFNAGIGGKDGGVDVAAETLKVKIKSLISTEDSRRPLSDQKIVEILEKEGIRVARRTIAKYRDVMGIDPSAKRKKKKR